MKSNRWQIVLCAALAFGGCGRLGCDESLAKPARIADDAGERKKP